MMLRLADMPHGEGVASTERTWQKLMPGIPFDYYFLEDEFKNDFSNEERLKAIVTAIALISVVLAALGIFGTTLFVVQNKTKEVAIRKVLGSDRSRLLILLFFPLFVLLAIASLVGMPMAYLSGIEWLAGYPYRVGFSLLWFIFSFLGILAVMMTAIIYHFLKVTSVNPVTVLKQDQ